MECRMVQSAISGQRTIMYHTPHDDAYVCMCMYVKNRQHQHQHTRVHAHTEARGATPELRCVRD